MKVAVNPEQKARQNPSGSVYLVSTAPPHKLTIAKLLNLFLSPINTTHIKDTISQIYPPQTASTY